MQHQFGNRQSMASIMSLNWRQVHGVKVVEVTSPHQQCGEVDGLWTRVPKLRIAVITADCVPMLLYRNDGKAVAALHAGWRGAYEQIVESFIKSLPSDLSRPMDWKAIVGPSIRSCCYEVSPELISQFTSRFSWISSNKIEPSARKLDLIAVLQGQCQKLGVPVESVHPDCTRCSLDGENLKYFSYRAGDRSSRQYSWIEL